MKASSAPSRPAALVVACVVAIAMYSWGRAPRKQALEYASRTAAYCSAPVDGGAEGGPDVIAATVVVRHGARSAIHEPTGALAYDCGLSASAARVAGAGVGAGGTARRCDAGELVSRGYEQHLRLGAFLRGAYGAADGTWAPPTARSTNYGRTRASARAFLTGFAGGAVPGASAVEAYEDPGREPMFGIEGEDGRGLDCPAGRAAAAAQRRAWRTDAATSAAVRERLPGVEEGFRPTEIADAAYSLACERGLPLCDGSSCLDEKSAEAVLDAADLFYSQRYQGSAGGKRASSLGMYSLLDEIVDGFDAVLADATAPKRLALYAGHDTVVAPLLAALGAFDGRWPPLASRVVFELLRGARVRVLFNGKQVPAFGARAPTLADFRRGVDALLGGAATFEAACRVEASRFEF